MNCPYCRADLELAESLPQYDVNSVCPACTKTVKVSYDFSLTEDYEEIPIYSLGVHLPDVMDDSVEYELERA